MMSSTANVSLRACYWQSEGARKTLQEQRRDVISVCKATCEGMEIRECLMAIGDMKQRGEEIFMDFW